MLKFSFANNLLNVPEFKKPQDIENYFEKEFGKVSREMFNAENPDFQSEIKDKPNDTIYALAALITEDETESNNALSQSDIITYKNNRYKILMVEPTPENIPEYLVRSFGHHARIFSMIQKSIHGETGNDRFTICESYSSDAFDRCKQAHILRQTAVDLKNYRYNLNIQ